MAEDYQINFVENPENMPGGSSGEALAITTNNKWVTINFSASVTLFTRQTGRSWAAYSEKRISIGCTLICCG